VIDHLELTTLTHASPVSAAAQLPTTFTTSLFWSDDELKESQSEQFIGTCSANINKK
jgi:hypothetical protein